MNVAVRVSVVVCAAALGLVGVWPGPAVLAVVSPLVPLDTQSQQMVTPRLQTGDDPAVRRSHAVTVNLRTLPVPTPGTFLGALAVAPSQPALTLDLFPDVFVTATFDRFEPNASGVTWVGRIQGDPFSSVTLVYGDGLLTASIVSSTGTYGIRPASALLRRGLPAAAGEVHVVTEFDQSALPPEADPIPVVVTAEEAAIAAATIAEDTADVIDVMVVYTPTSQLRAGGPVAITQLIATAVAETNTAYANSGVHQRIRLVHTTLVNYAEHDSFNTNLSELRAGEAAGLEGVADLRDQYAADLVMMLVHPAAPSACGIAYVMNTVSPAFAPSGYSVTYTNCMSPGFTFAHELGHNMGLHHDWYMSTSPLPYPYAHGYVNPSAPHRWRTIMAYPNLCTQQGVVCRRLLAWSNPDQMIEPVCNPVGFPCNQSLWFLPPSRMGVLPGTRSNCQASQPNNAECDADARRALNNTALTVANFRQSVSAAPRP